MLGALKFIKFNIYTEQRLLLKLIIKINTFLLLIKSMLYHSILF